MNYHLKPTDIVEFQTCDLGDKEIGYVLPDKKKVSIQDCSNEQILMCSNKINDQKEFNTAMTYHITILYDMIRANIDWKNCKQIACMHIRGMNLAKICRAGYKECFQRNLREGLYETEVCKGKEGETFEPTYQTCIKDISPINLVKSPGSNPIF